MGNGKDGALATEGESRNVFTCLRNNSYEVASDKQNRDIVKWQQYIMQNLQTDKDRSIAYSSGTVATVEITNW